MPSQGDPPPEPSQLCPCPAPAAGAGGPRGTNCGQCTAQDVLHSPRPSHARPAPRGRLPESAGSSRNLGPAAATASAAGPDGFPQRTKADEAWRAVGGGPGSASRRTSRRKSRGAGLTRGEEPGLCLGARLVRRGGAGSGEEPGGRLGSWSGRWGGAGLGEPPGRRLGAWSVRGRG